MKAYHVTSAKNRQAIEAWGLMSANEQTERFGEMPDNKWEDLVDTDVVCLFRADEYEGALDMADYFVERPAIVVTLELPEPDEAREWGLSYTTVDEGYLAVYNRIDKRFVIEITEV